MDVMVVERPTKVAVPELPQPPPLLKWVKTSWTLFRGASTHSGMIIAKSPMTWMIKISPSTNGKFFARNVLNKMENAEMAITNMVPCHRWKS